MRCSMKPCACACACACSTYPGACRGCAAAQQVFAYVARGLFERHKLILATQLCFQILARAGELDAPSFQFLLRGPALAAGAETGAPPPPNPLKEWLSDSAWDAVLGLRQLEVALLFLSVCAAARAWAGRPIWCRALVCVRALMCVRVRARVRACRGLHMFV